MRNSANVGYKQLAKAEQVCAAEHFVWLLRAKKKGISRITARQFLIRTNWFLVETR